MERKDLVEAISYINLDEKTQERMAEELAECYGDKAYDKAYDRAYNKKGNIRKARGYFLRLSGYGRVAAAVFALIVAAGVSVPTYALVNSFVKARMEGMPQEEVDTLYQQVQDAPVEADSFNREYSKEEQERMKQLYTEYQEGRFPEKELLTVSSESEGAEYEQKGEICFLPAFSRFYLPLDREMTDEEILEVLDFITKRDYALVQKTKEDLADEAQAREEEQRNLIQENVENGGITEEQAIELARGRLKELGLDVEGYQQKVLFYEERPGDDFNEGGAFYQVSWYSQEALKYYYFMLDAGNGELLDERIFEEFTRVPGALD